MNKLTALTALTVGMRVQRKRDGAQATIIAREIATGRPGSIPGPVIITLQFDNGEFDATGPLSWVRSFFTGVTVS